MEKTEASSPWLRPRRVLALALLTAVAALFMLPTLSKATITEQRARLPPPARCEDEVEGVWKSHSYWQHHGQWYVFMLEIHRVKGSPNQLIGQLTSHFWDGGPDDEEPPPCRAGGYQQLVRMPGVGEIRDGVVSFGGTTYTLERTFCGPNYVNYYPDNFSGRIDPDLQEFQSVNNDGGPAVNVPQVFRRIRCLDPNAQPHVTVTPPAFQPPARGGCGWPF